MNHILTPLIILLLVHHALVPIPLHQLYQRYALLYPGDHSDSLVNHLTQCSYVHPSSFSLVCNPNKATAVMETIDDSEVENVDPRFTELALLLSSYCDRMTHESIKTEREHTNEKIKVVIKKLSELNQDIVNHDNKIRDLNMKIDTFFAYHEELLFNLKSGLQDTFQCVQDDMKYVLTKLERGQGNTSISCVVCGKTFPDLQSYQYHQCITHKAVFQLQQQNLPSTTCSNNQKGQLSEAQNTFACHLCDKLLPSQSDLVNHLKTIHGKMDLLSCNVCSNIFESEDDLSYHKLSHHTQGIPNYSSNLSLSPVSHADVDQDHHSAVPIQATPISPILQLDGAVDDLHGGHSQQLVVISPAELLSNMPSHTVSYSAPTANIVTQSFRLDQSKQLKRLKKDSTLSNFEVEINKSEENVNILCSVGFYAKVALPTFEHIAAGAETVADNVSVICHDVTKRTDANGAATTTVIIYRLYQDKISIGQVTVHLHHTTRNVQLQGSALMPNNSKAPVWFLQNILRNKFTRLSDTQTQDILQLNKAVVDTLGRDMNPTNRSSCAGCKASFTGRSSPEMCSHCSLYYHKKCLPSSNHTCHTRIGSVPASRGTRGVNTRRIITHVTSSIAPHTPAPLSQGPSSTAPDIPAPVSSNSSVVTNQNTELISSGHLTLDNNDTHDLSINQAHPVSTSFSPVTASQPASHPSPINHTPHNTIPYIYQPEDLFHPSIPGTSRVTPTTQKVSSSSLNPLVLPFVSGLPDTSAPVSSAAKGKVGKSSGRNTKKGGNLDLETAHYEVNVTKAKLCEQEVTIKDLRFKNKLLETRVADLEAKQKENIYNKYFPRETSNTSPEPIPNFPSNHIVFSCCRSHQSSTSKVFNSDGADIMEKIDAIKEDIKNLKYRMDVQNDVVFPKMLRDSLEQFQYPTSTPAVKTTPTTCVPHTATSAVTYTTSVMTEPAVTSNISIDESHTSIDDALHDISMANDLN